MVIWLMPGSTHGTLGLANHGAFWELGSLKEVTARRAQLQVGGNLHML